MSHNPLKLNNISFWEDSQTASRRITELSFSLFSPNYPRARFSARLIFYAAKTTCNLFNSHVEE